ncbi:hypothetical protein [Cylindrospermopsis raciborskii]|uniref:hypothetical protein n=1 Tax=Cylindrospermopsis raciborskii TaxID=77022 RepID=UPI000E1EE253|nr:hypothetical protein [Cylindrospermopsis raciborskii]TPX27837.1 hypothetical protein FIV49_06090 [Cylindrospermopsis raciborskii GIHE 2018]UJL34864.1 hypothetical protein C6N34_006760 [Cylindrospermopsis raciborskii Cr2010]UJS04382.1 hypothetical protein L3I90_15100 [Cylindrospermopsis raciborskii KLL07]
MVFIEPEPTQFLPLQQQLYPDPNLPTENPGFAIHPVTGEWQDVDGAVGRLDLRVYLWTMWNPIP